MKEGLTPPRLALCELRCKCGTCHGLSATRRTRRASGQDRMSLDSPATVGAVLTAVLDALPAAVIVVGDDTRVAAANDRAREILPALRPGEPLALFLRDPNVLDAAPRVLQSGTAEVVSWRDRVPVDRDFEVTVARFEAGAASPVLMLTLRDRTEARRVEHMRADFIANASHELRTPLASLLGFIETLQGPARDDTVARERFLAIMAEQGRRMARLIDDLLSLSRIEQTLHLRPSHPVDLGILVRHVADTLAPLAAGRGVTLAVETADPVVVGGDRDELIRVAENVIENAIKYGCGGPGPDGIGDRVEIVVARHGREAVFTVRDHGPGIAPHHLPRLTERFYRIDPGQSRAQGGTGLGLALVKHIVARHRGRLTIDSTPGSGATFVATLPLLLHGTGTPERSTL